MLTLCCHPVLCLLLYVCMVLTSSEAKFCQVCSGLTFSLSRHVYSSPIPIKTSTFSSPCTLLHHILHPSTSAPSLPLAARVLIILTCTLLLNLNNFFRHLSLSFHLQFFFVPYISVSLMKCSLMLHLCWPHVGTRGIGCNLSGRKWVNFCDSIISFFPFNY